MVVLCKYGQDAVDHSESLQGTAKRSEPAAASQMPKFASKPGTLAAKDAGREAPRPSKRQKPEEDRSEASHNVTGSLAEMDDFFMDADQPLPKFDAKRQAAKEVKQQVRWWHSALSGDGSELLFSSVRMPCTLDILCTAASQGRHNEPVTIKRTQAA